MNPHTGTLGTEKDSEFRCGTCKARCTRSPSDGTEYGHLIGCPHRPDDLTIGSSGGGHYYRPDSESVSGGESA
ncbi:hypothetical protein JCM18549_27620 [Halolamina salina]